MMERDCNDGKSGECVQCVMTYFRELNAITYNKAIDDFVKAIEKHQTRQDSYLEPPYVEMGLDMTDILEVAEQLKKGGKNEN